MVDLGLSSAPAHKKKGVILDTQGPFPPAITHQPHQAPAQEQQGPGQRNLAARGSEIYVVNADIIYVRNIMPRKQDGKN
jgi:hypothetical protein